MNPKITSAALAVGLLAGSAGALGAQATPPPRTAVQACHWSKSDMSYFLRHPRAPILRKACLSERRPSDLREQLRRSHR